MKVSQSSAQATTVPGVFRLLRQPHTPPSPLKEAFLLVCHPGIIRDWSSSQPNWHRRQYAQRPFWGLPATFHLICLLWRSRLPRVRVWVISCIQTRSHSLMQCPSCGCRPLTRFHIPPQPNLHYHALFLHRPLGSLTLGSELCLTDVSPSVAAEGAQPVAAVTPSVLNVQQGQRAEFRCTVTGKPTPAIEWIGMTT